MYKRLHQELTKRGLSRHALAVTSGINPPSLYQAMSGLIPMWPAWKTRIADALDLPVDELFEEGSNNE